ncbi:MAG: hypothetical protein BZY88_11410 [SAR202 cluster bacterium Io17-Chloro-G9]|nr:MAG: hypothetical protein BZY88_11410 [SAR202 cluster bacterium Io17-Chloro-G9]
MIRAIKKGKHFFLLAGLGLSLLVLLACTSGDGTPLPADQGRGSQNATGTDISQLLAAFDRLGESSALGQAISRSQSVGALSNNNTGIWITGRGEATTAPDLAILNLGVEASADTVSEARDQAAAAMEGTLAALTAGGIAERDIQTSFFNISPKYTSREVTRCPATREQSSSRQIAPPLSSTATPAPAPAPASAPSAGLAVEPEPIMIVSGISVEESDQPEDGCFTEHERVIIGYQVSNQLTVKVRDLDSAGEIIDQVTAAGGNLTRFQGIRFAIEDNETFQDEARAAAIADLLEKSSQVANLTGVELGQLVYITESGGPVQVQFESARALSAPAFAAPTPIMAGELNVVVTMQAMFAIQGSGS